MKFSEFKIFKPFSQNLESVLSYLTVEMKKGLTELNVGLTKLSFLDNFDSFIVEVDIPATSEIAIRNRLPSGAIPSQRIVVRGKAGAENIVDGDTEWTTDFLYLKNTGGAAAQASVLFLR